jgi:hypothetical protein
MIENWIDALTKVWEFDTGRNRLVKSIRLFEKAEFPETIDPTGFPLAITIPPALNDAEYSAGGPKFGIYKGVTEFHISPNCAKGELPYVSTYIGKIWKAVALNASLGGLVEYFMLDADSAPVISAPLALKYGDEAEHWGVLVNWIVKEHVTSQVVFSSG